jgi:hypothetical protein
MYPVSCTPPSCLTQSTTSSKSAFHYAELRLRKSAKAREAKNNKVAASLNLCDAATYEMGLGRFERPTSRLSDWRSSDAQRQQASTSARNPHSDSIWRSLAPASASQRAEILGTILGNVF